MPYASLVILTDLDNAMDVAVDVSPVNESVNSEPISSKNAADPATSGPLFRREALLPPEGSRFLTPK